MQGSKVGGQRLDAAAAMHGVGVPALGRDPRHDVGEDRRLLAKAPGIVARELDVAATVERGLQAKLVIARHLLGDPRLAAVFLVPQGIFVERILDALKGQGEHAEIGPRALIALRRIALSEQALEHRRVALPVVNVP